MGGGEGGGRGKCDVISLHIELSFGDGIFHEALSTFVLPTVAQETVKYTDGHLKCQKGSCYVPHLFFFFFLFFLIAAYRKS